MPTDDNVDDADFIGTHETIPPAASDRDNGKKWAIALTLVGCGCVGLPLLLIALSISGIVSTAQRFYQSTGTYQVYQLASARVETDAAVISVLGQPVEAGWTSQSHEAYETGSDGIVCLRFAVNGGDRSGSAYAEARQQDGAWQLHQLLVAANGVPEPVAIVPLAAAAAPLCPDFEDESPPPNAPEDGISPPGTAI
ncbi:MAG TPA: cytochrome c oxidase assembly factor Coa1 family protein [Candidatus Obscuribacterales bacterium]